MPEEFITPLTNPEGGSNRGAERPEANIQIPSKRIEQEVAQAQAEQAFKEQHDLPAGTTAGGVEVFVEPGVKEKQDAAMAEAKIPAGAADLTGPLIGKIIESDKDIEDAKNLPPEQVLESILNNIGKGE